MLSDSPGFMKIGLINKQANYLKPARLLQQKLMMY